MPTTTPLRSVLTRTAVLRLLLGWGSFLAVTAAAPLLAARLPDVALWSLLAAIVAVITVCAFGVVTEAEHLSHRLGDPYGTLVLTLSIVLIEVILIAAVLLGPGEHPTIARDSVMAVSMIILNLVIGVALIVGALRQRALRANRRGVWTYLVLLAVLLVVAFALPALIGHDGQYSPVQAVPVVVLTVIVYAFFLLRQMGRRRRDFQEPVAPVPAASETETDGADRPRADIGEVLREHRGEIIARTLLLIATVIPIVLLSHDMATLLDDGLDRLGAPIALSGIVIAMIVFLPETITTIRAAHQGEMQRVSNLCHGALVSTVGLTIPAVLTIGLLTGQPIVLAEQPFALLLLAVTLVLTVFTVAVGRARVIGAVLHLAVFAVYLISVFV